MITRTNIADLIAGTTFVDKAITVVVFVVAFFALFWEDGLVALAKGLIGGTTLYARLTKAVAEISVGAILGCLVLGADAAHTFLVATTEEAATFLFRVDSEAALPLRKRIAGFLFGASVTIVVFVVADLDACGRSEWLPRRTDQLAGP